MSGRLTWKQSLGMPFPAILRQRAITTPGRPGMRVQRYGVWREWTWKEIDDAASAFGLGLLALGFEKGDRVALMARPSLPALISSLGIQGVGCVPVGIFPPTNADGIRYIVNNSEARGFVGSESDLVAKFLSTASSCQSVEHIVLLDSGDGTHPQTPEKSWKEVLDLGRTRRSQQSEEWESSVAALTLDDICGIHYTSGTTGQPKGAMLSHRNFLRSYFAPFGSDAGMLRPLSPSDSIMHEIPIASMAGPLFGIYFPLVYGAIGHVPDPRVDPTDALREVSPTFFFGYPRTWELKASQALGAIETSSMAGRSAYRIAMAVRRRAMNAAWASRPVPLVWAALSLVAHALVFKPMLDKMGYGRFRWVLSGGAPLSPELVKLWWLWGVHIRELYGLTECGGLATLQTDAVPLPGLAGRAIPGVELKLADDGEILIRGECVFSGYFQRPDATAQALDPEGWLHSGDIGHLEPDGNLKVVDRKSDVVFLKSGQMIPVSELEHVLKQGRHIQTAIVVGEGKPFLGALIELDFGAVGDWARRNGINEQGAALAEHSATTALIGSEIEEANRVLIDLGKQPIQAFRILPRALNPDDPTEVTSTRKVRRRGVIDKFQYFVEEMYSNDQSERFARQVYG
jgi:long-chain acyl-CoA synthetase